MAAQYATPEAIRQMRKDGGGLIILMVAPNIASHLGLPFLTDLFTTSQKDYPVLCSSSPTTSRTTPNPPSPSTSTTARPSPASPTTTAASPLKVSPSSPTKSNASTATAAQQRFGSLFRTPGHVPICAATPGLTANRQGHTELTVALLLMSGLIPVGTGCEMMGDSGKALPKDQAKHYADDHHLTYLEGKDIMEAWTQWSP